MDEQMQYRKKPVVIEAIQWTGENLDAVMRFCSGNATYELMFRGNSEIVIQTLEDGKDKIAQHVASKGDYIIQGVQGEFYPCKPDIFRATYDPAALSQPAAAPSIWGIDYMGDCAGMYATRQAAEAELERRNSEYPNSAKHRRVTGYTKAAP